MCIPKKRICIFLTTFILLNTIAFSETKENSLINLQQKISKNPSKGIWEGKKRLVLKEELSIGVKDGDRNLIFHEPMDIEVDKDGNIYVLDKGNFRIQKFDQHGRFLLTIGKKGQGPGELMGVLDFEIDNKGNICVFDMENSRISIFDSQGTFRTSIKLEYQPRQGVIDSKGNFYIYERYNRKLIHKYDPSGEYLISFMDEIIFEPKRIEPHINGLGYITVHKDKIYLCMIYPYTLYIFDEKGQLLEKIITDASFSKPPFLSPEGIVITNFIITGLAVSPQDYILVKAIYFDVPSNWKEKLQEIMANLYKNSFLDVFDSSGRYLLHHKIPDFTWGMTFDPKGYLYMIKQEEEYWRVVKYKVEFK